jgi:hypothetical protein
MVLFALAVVVSVLIVVPWRAARLQGELHLVWDSPRTYFSGSSSRERPVHHGLKATQADPERQHTLSRKASPHVRALGTGSLARAHLMTRTTRTRNWETITSGSVGARGRDSPGRPTKRGQVLPKFV